MMTLKAVGFDLFGTLLHAKGEQTTCLNNLHKRLFEGGINISRDIFLEAFHEVHANNRTIKTSNDKEITNQQELEEVLRSFGYNVNVDTSPIPEAVGAYFSSWRVTVFKDVYTTLRNLGRNFKTGVITNFTDSKFIYKSLRNLNLLDMLDCVVISGEVGWRKPNPKIFQKFLELTMVRADETLFVGDDIHSDIYGANAVGIITTLLVRENYTEEVICNTQPDFIISSLNELNKVVNNIERK